MTKPSGFMEAEFWEITKKLIEAGYTILDEEYLSQPLPCEATIETLHCIPDLGESYRVFDAIFYWSD